MDDFTITKSVTKNGAKIVVIGVGGGGQNMLEALLETPVADEVTLVAANADLQALDNSKVAHKIQLGPELTHGLGCGMKPEIGREAAIESKDEIRKAFLA